MDGISSVLAPPGLVAPTTVPGQRQTSSLPTSRASTKKKKKKPAKKPPKKHGKKRPKKKPKPKPAPTPSPAPAPAPIVPPADQATVNHLLARTTFGATPELVTQVRAVGWSQWLASQLDHDSIADPTGDTVRNLYPDMAADITATRSAIREFSWDSMFALGQGTLGLAIWSRRQLFEVMVDFWSNHLNVTNPSDRVWDNRADYDRTVIRKFALDNFSDMLVASATHPAMLQYLNNAASTKTAPNENYGRELLELHTVGVDAGYTEGEVLNSARIMTGWTTTNTGLATYRTSRHWTGRVHVLGFTDSNGAPDGRSVAEAYLRYLAAHPQTARRIATKLCERFVSDTAPNALVERLASTYVRAGTAIRPVLTELFHSDEFWASSGKKVRRPYEDLVATVRSLGHQLLPGSASERARRKGMESLYWMAQQMRQAPLAWTLPDGYPDVASAWRAAAIALARLNTPRTLVEGRGPDDSVLALMHPEQLLPTPLPATYGQLVDAVSMRLVYDVLPNAPRAAILRFFGKSASSALDPDDDVVGWRAGTLAALILDSPSHGRR